MKPTKKQIIGMISQDMIAAANTFAMTKAFTMTIRPIVEGYQKEILARHKFVNKKDKELTDELHAAGKNLDRQYEEKVILNPKHSFLLSDEDFGIYLNECREAQAKAGLKTDHPDKDPLLVAEHLESMAQRAFVDLMKPISKMDSNMALSSADGIKNFNKLADLNMGLIASLGLLKNTMNKEA